METPMDLLAFISIDSLPGPLKGAIVPILISPTSISIFLLRVTRSDGAQPTPDECTKLKKQLGIYCANELPNVSLTTCTHPNMQLTDEHFAFSLWLPPMLAVWESVPCSDGQTVSLVNCMELTFDLAPLYHQARQLVIALRQTYPASEPFDIMSPLFAELFPELAEPEPEPAPAPAPIIVVIPPTIPQA